MSADDDREALRRRLYRPGASEADRLRYVGTLEVDEPAPEAEPPRRPSRRAGVVASALVGVVAVTIAILVGRAALAPPSVDTAVAAPPAPTASSILPTQRVATSIDGLATTGLRVEGNGSAEVPLDVSDASFGGGRLAVLLSSSDGRPVGWTAQALETRRDWSSYRARVASSPARDRLDDARPDEVRYAGVPPRWIQVQAPADAVWTLTVTFASSSDAQLR